MGFRAPPRPHRRRAAKLAHQLLVGAAVTVVWLLACAAARGPLPAGAFVSGPWRGGAAAPPVAATGRAAAAVEGAPAAPVAQAVEVPDRDSITNTVSEAEFWTLVERAEVEEAIMLSWSRRNLVARLRGGEFAAVQEESDAEDIRNRLVKVGIPFRYPEVDRLTEEQALQMQAYSSEGAVASGVATAAAVGIADSLLEVGAGGWVLGGGSGAVVSQSIIEREPPQQVLAEDLGTLSKDIKILGEAASQAEKVVEADVRFAEQLASKEVDQAESVFGQAWGSSVHWFQDVSTGLVKNHAPGVGGIIEDSFMALLVGVSLFSLYKQIYLKRKSNSWQGFAHTATGAMQIAIVLYAIVEERCLRESPGPVWAIFTFIIFMVNNLTMWPLLKYFNGPEVYRVLFKLAYSFIISFQGIHCIAFSSQYPWLYWLVMPFWFYSVKKLVESADNILALLPDGTVPIAGVQEAARRRVKGIQNDASTIVYSALNFGGAVFDNLYMAVYTWRGPAGFWGWSQANIPAVNDHLRTALVKPAFGSLTISVLVFLGTLVYRKQMNSTLGIGLNIILASVGPWLILYYHKLIDWDEPWQPEIAGDWGSTPYFFDHFGEVVAFLGIPLAVVGSGKALAAATAADAPSVLEGAGAGAASADGVGAAVSAAAEAMPFDPVGQRASMGLWPFGSR